MLMQQDAFEGPPSKRETSAALGFSLTQGKSDTDLATGDVLGLRKWELNEYAASINGSYDEVERVQNSGVVR